jgi:uncharacterized protein YkwD
MLGLHPERQARMLALVVVAASLSHAAPQEDRLEAAVLTELNVLRANPPAYAKKLEAMRASYRGKLLFRGPGERPIATVEGVAALDEAIADLKAARPAVPLTDTIGLGYAARDYVAQQGPTGQFGHKGTDGSNSFQRISRHGHSGGLSGEVIDYGWTDAENIVIDLLIDDGVADRGHRKNVLHPLYAQAGVACGPHARYGTMCVVEMAEQYADDTAIALGGAR